MASAMEARPELLEGGLPSEGDSAITRGPPERRRKGQDPRKNPPKDGGPPPEAHKKGIAGNLAPITELPEMVDELVDRVPERSRPAAREFLNDGEINIATVCSGTEAPLAISVELQRSLERIGVSLSFTHLFSCEIAPPKQAYIERNFQPKHIFTDVRDLAQNKQALTAYGALQDVPGDVSFLVAGFSCVDFSTLNPRPKGVEQCGESGDTLRAILNYAKKFRPKAMILENVSSAQWGEIEALVQNNRGSDKVKSEAAQTHLDAIWGDRAEDSGYSTVMCKVNTADYCLPQTRKRGYMVCIDRSKIKKAGADKIAIEWGRLLKEDLYRPASSPMEDFLLSPDDPRVCAARDSGGLNEYGEMKKRTESTWLKCKLRYANYREAIACGQMRPLTRWLEGGVCHPPEHWWKAWANFQPDRLREHWDISHLRSAQRGYDSQFKTRVWELSQNIDRSTDTSPWGVAGCVTPTGQAFITTRGGQLTPSEALILQGLPVDKIDLGRLSDREVQDLAGNAMSTTVVGAAILALLMAAPELLTSFLPRRVQGSETTGQKTQVIISRFNLTRPRPLNLTHATATAVPTLISEAKKSHRLCHCESQNRNTGAQISQCKDCGHTSCTKCSSTHSHSYEKLEGHMRTSPVKFARLVTDALPMILHIIGDFIPPSLRRYTETSDDLTIMRLALRSLAQEEFRFQEVSRSHCWTVSFEGESHILKLKVDDGEVSWLLFIKPAKTVVGNARIRKIARYPIARMILDAKADNLLVGLWELSVPTTEPFQIQIDTREEYTTISSWRAKLGLPDLRYEEYHRKLDISTVSSQLDHDQRVISLTGTYELLPKCETAAASLYKKTEIESDGSQIYFFLDPERVESETKDRYVFAKTHHRLAHREVREIIARLAVRWEPFQPTGTFQCTAYSRWIPCKWQLKAPEDTEAFLYSTLKDDSEFEVPDGFVPQVVEEDSSSDDEAEAGITHPPSSNAETQGRVEQPPSAVVPQESAMIISPSPDGPQDVMLSPFAAADCQSLHMVLTSLDVPSNILDMDTWNLGTITQTKQRQIARQLVWVYDRLQLHREFSVDWMYCDVPSSPGTCEKCAPILPAIRWARSKSKKKITPYEDHIQAARFERALKARCPIIVCKLTSRRSRGRIDIGVNWASLSHRAMGKLPHRPEDMVELKCRIEPIERDQTSVKFPQLTLENCKGCSVSDYTFPTKERLRPEQSRALQQMFDQEKLDVLPRFPEEAREEALLPEHGLRVHALFGKCGAFRGGILAHEVGFGKTALILALIDDEHARAQAQAQAQAPAPAIPHNPVPSTDAASPANVEGKIVSKATLILVPPTIVKQWESQIHKFLGKGKYDVVVIANATGLGSLTVRRIRDADIVIVSSKLFESPVYRDGIAALGNLPLQYVSKGRLFQAWYDKAAVRMKKNVEYMKANGLEGLTERLTSRFVKEFLDPKLIKPISTTRLTGKAYAEDAANRQKKQEAKNQQDEEDSEDPEAPRLVEEDAGDQRGEEDDEADMTGVEGQEEEKEEQVERGEKKEKKEKKKKEEKEEEEEPPEQLKARAGVEIARILKRFKLNLPDPTTRRPKTELDQLSNPILQNFHFARLVIDEATYVDDSGHVLIAAIQAPRRWVLSGTPRLGDFMDVKQLAHFIDFDLGEDDDTPGVMKDYNVKKTRRQRTQGEEFRGRTDVRSMEFHRDRHTYAQDFLGRFARQDQPEIGEIKVATRYLGVQLTSTERALELELYHSIDESGVSTKMPRGPTSRVPDNKVDRIREALKNCSNPIEVLLLVPCFFFWPKIKEWEEDEDISTMTNEEAQVRSDRMYNPEEALSPSEAVCIVRKAEYAALCGRISFFMKKTVHLHGRFCENLAEFDHVSPFFVWLKELRAAQNTASGNVNRKMLSIFDRCQHAQDDESQFEKDPKAQKTNGETMRRLVGALSISERKADPRADDIKHFDFNGAYQDLWSATNHCRQLAQELASRMRAVHFMKTLQCCQAWAANPAAPVVCSKCNQPCSDRHNTRVVGPCGHIYCGPCYADIPSDRGICTMQDCDAIMVQNSQYTAALLGTDDGDYISRRFGAKVKRIVKLVLEEIPIKEQVLLFVQFDKLMEPLSQALEENGISNYALCDRNAASHGTTMFEFQENKTAKAKRMLILNSTKDTAAGANLTNANHVIFLSTFWADSHHSYRQSMTQCIGRSRRYGQRKTVNVYRIIALDTVDVDVLEWRESGKLLRRMNGSLTLREESALTVEERAAESLGTGFLKNNGYYEREDGAF